MNARLPGWDRSGRLRRVGWLLVMLVLLAFVSSPAVAQENARIRALAWLAHDGSQAPRDAAETARALRRARVPVDARGLATFAPVDFRHGAWRATLTEDEVAVATLLRFAGTDGGFGAASGHAAAAVDTAEVLLSAADVEYAPPGSVARALGALLRRQRPDGGFAANGLDADLPTTCLALRALGAWPIDARSAEAMQAAVTWLRAADVASQPVLYVALRADALAAAGVLAAPDVAGLLALQGADGAFFDTQGTAAGVRALLGAAADLQFAEARLSAAEAPAGPPVELRLEIRNRGLTASGPTLVGVDVEGAPGRQLVLPGLAPGESAHLSAQVETAGLLGGVTVVARLDPDDRVPESDESDQERRLLLHLRRPAAADLELRPDLLALSPAHPMAGEAFTVLATVRNRGDEPAQATRLALYRGTPEAGGARLAEVDVPALAAHSETLVRVPLVGLPAQATRLTALVDPAHLLEEVHTANNRAVRSLRIAGDADLALLPGALMLEPGPVLGVGTPLRLRVRVQNHGLGAAAATVVSVEDAEGPELARADVPPLAPGAFAEVALGFTPDTPGARALLVRADAEDTLIELDEVDNFVAQALVVEDADLQVEPGDPAVGIATVAATDHRDFSFFAHNRASLPAPSVRTALRRGAPDGPVHVWGRCGPFPAAPRGGRTTRACPLGAWVEGLPAGRQSLYACVDADDTLVERDESNNCRAIVLNVEPRRDVRVSLVFEPPVPEPGQWVDLTWRTQADATLGYTLLRIRAGDEPVFTRGVDLNASETIRWRAPDRRTEVAFVATLDGGRDVVDANRDDNRFETTVLVGGPPAVVEVVALGPDRAGPAVAGRAGWLRVGVDAPTQVSVNGQLWPATPAAPAYVPHTPPAAGEATVGVATVQRPEVLAWPVEIRRPGPPAGLAAAFAPEGVALSWGAVPGAVGYQLSRDGRPIRPPDLVLPLAVGPPAALAPRTTSAVVLPEHAWIGAVRLDLAAAHDSLRVHWRVDALTETGRWSSLHEEGGAGGVPGVWRAVPPVRARHLRLQVFGATLAAFPANFSLRGFSDVALTAVLDTHGGAEPAVYTVAAHVGGALTEASAPISFDRALEAPDLSATIDGARVRLTVAPLPGDRSAGFLVEVDGRALASEPFAADGLYPVALLAAASPLELPVALRDGTAIRREVVWGFDRPRFVTAVPAIIADDRWRLTDPAGGVFAPGILTGLRAWRPATDEDADLDFDPTVEGPAMLPAEGGVLELTLRQGLRTVSVFPVDAEGRRGVPGMLPVAVGGPRGLVSLEARAEAGAVRLDWQAPPELAALVLSTPWGQVERVAAGQGTFRFLPRFGGGPVAGHIAVHVVPVDTLGNSAPARDVAVDLVADLPPVENLEVDVRGVRITVRWALPRPGDAMQFALTVDGMPAGSALASPVELRVPAAGPHVVGVAPMTAFGAVGPPVTAEFDIADDGAPRPVVFVPADAWARTLSGFAIAWTAVPEDDAVALDLGVNDETPVVRNPETGTYSVPWRVGLRSYRVTGRVRDGTAHTSALTEAVLVPPASFPPDGFRAGPVLADGTVPLVPPTAALSGHFVYRDGARLCAWENQGMAEVRLSGGQWTPHLSPFGRPSDDNVPWVTEPDDAHPQATVSYGFRPEGTPVDRLQFEFATPGGVPDAFHVEARAVGAGWVEIARVAGNAAPSLTLDVPDTPRVGAWELRLTIDHHAPGASVQLRRFGAEVCRPPAHDAPAQGGRFLYTARTWGPDGSPGPLSSPQEVQVPLTNLRLAAGSLRLSDDEYLPGDTLAVVAPVENRGRNGASAVAVVLRMARADCTLDAVEISRVHVDVAAGETVAAVLAWPVDDTTGVLCVEVDPENAVPEQREDDNETSRTVVPDRPYRTQIWANGELAIFACDREIAWAARPAGAGLQPSFGTLVPGAATALALRGSVAISADGPFALHVGALRDATSTLLRDCQGEVLTRDVTGDVPQNRPLSPAMSARSPGVVVFAPEAAAHVIGSEPFQWQGATTSPSGLELFEGEVASGTMRVFNPHTRPAAVGTNSVRLLADAPIIAWSYADLGFPFVGPDGRMTGTDLRGFVALGSSQFQQQADPGEEVVVVSYDADNRIELERTDTGQTVASFLLAAHGMGAHFFPAASNEGFIPLRIRATGRTAAFNMSLFGSPAFGYAHALFVPGESGLLFDRRFVVPLTTNGRDEDFAPVTALYDATRVRVLAPDTGEEVFRGTLARGASVDLLSDAVVTDNPARRRLVVESDRPVSVYVGVGTAGAEMAPVLFAPENRPDLRVENVEANPPMPVPGELVAMHGELRNDGVVRARGVVLRVFDGPPEAGRELHSQRVPRLDAGQPVPVDFVLGVGEGVRILTWIVDPDDTIPETREDNNVVRFTLANPPDLVAGAPEGTLTVGVTGALRLPVRNDGGQAVAGSTLRVFADQQPLGATRVDVGPGEIRIVEFPWRPQTPGPVIVRLEVEAPEGVEEARLDNNQSTAELRIAPVDRDLSGVWTVSPSNPGPCDPITLDVRLNVPAIVAVEAWAGARRLAAGRTGADGRASLDWAEDKALGPHALRLVVDSEDDIVERDENNNTTAVTVEVVPDAIALEVEGPAGPVGAGSAVALRITPTASLPADAWLEAPGFAPARADGDAAVVLAGLAPEWPGGSQVIVKARAQGSVLATGSTTLHVTPLDLGLALRLWPVVAGPGVPVTLEVAFMGEGTLVFEVDGAEVSRVPTAAPRGLARAVVDEAAPGPHVVVVELRDDAERVLASAEGRYERAARLPTARVEVSVPDQSAAAGSLLTVSITLTNPNQSVPVPVDDVVVAVADEPPARVLREDRLGEAHLVGAAGRTVDVEVGPLPWRAGPWRLIVRAEGAGGVLGVGTAALLLFDTDAVPPPDAGAPADARNDPSRDARADGGDDERVDAARLDAAGDPRADAAKLDGGGDPRADGGRTDAGAQGDALGEAGLAADRGLEGDEAGPGDGGMEAGVSDFGARDARSGSDRAGPADRQDGRAESDRHDGLGADGFAGDAQPASGHPAGGCDCRQSPSGRGPRSGGASLVLLGVLGWAGLRRGLRRGDLSRRSPASRGR